MQHHQYKINNKMKNVFFLFAFLLSLNLIAQQTEGTIYYTQSIKLDIELPEGQEHLRDLIPSSSDQTKALYFTADKSMYKDVGDSGGLTEINQESDGTEMQVKIVSGSADNRLLKDLANNKMVDQRDFLGKNFLIKGAIPEMTWKITGEQKKVLDFVCQKAVQTKDSMTTIAWFTPQIPLSNGPDVYGQLPGMILELIMEDGKRTITATEVNFEPIDKTILETPTKGKKVSREAFKKIQEEKMKEMGSSNGRTVIRMEVDDRG